MDQQMEIFTKLSKVPFSHLSSVVHSTVDYVNKYMWINICIYARTYLQTMSWTFHGYHLNTHSHEFITYSEKPVFILKQRAVYLGFVIWFNNSTFSLTNKKKTKIKDCSMDILFCIRVTIRKFAKLIGNLVASSLQ